MSHASIAVNGIHILFYSSDADADRAFLRDALGFKSVDAGGGWMIFAMPHRKRPFILRRIPSVRHQNQQPTARC